MQHTQIEDSLQNLKPSPKKKSTSPTIKQEKQRTLFLQLKQKFIFALSKLQTSQTRQIGLQQMRQMIDKNRQQQHIRLFLSLMKSLKIEGTSSSTKQHQILVFSILAQINKQNLIDPIDKPNPSRVKTCLRIIQMLHPYFTDVSATVQQACARVIIDLGKYVLGIQSDHPPLDTQTYMALLFMPLSSILKSGVDKFSQSTASVCINEQIQYWKAHSNIPKYSELLDKICGQMLTVSLKLNSQYHEIFMSLSTLIQMKGLQFCGQKLSLFVSKILGVINKIYNKSTQENASNFNSYMCKVNVCGILEKIGQLIRDKPDIKSKLDELDVVPSLQKAARNRVIQVQMAASRALKVWNGQILPPDKRNNRPISHSSSNIQSRGYLSLQSVRNQKKRQRSSSKQQKLKIQRQLSHIQEDLNKLVKGGWGPHTRANNFTKKNTGGGGGYTTKMDQPRTSSPNNNANKSHKQHIEELRKFIKQNSKEHGNKDKFVFYEQKNQNIKNRQLNNKRNQERSRSISPSSPLPYQSNPQQRNSNKQLQKRQSLKSQKSPNQVTFQQPPRQQKSQQFGLIENQGDQMPQLHQKTEKDFSSNPHQSSQLHNSDRYSRFDTSDKQFLIAHKQQLQNLTQQNLKSAINQQQIKQLIQQQKSSSINKKNQNQPYPVESHPYNQQQSPKIKPNTFSHKINKFTNNQITLQNSLNQKPSLKKIKSQPQQLYPKLSNPIPPSKYTLQNIDNYQVSLEGISQQMSASLAIDDIMNESDFNGLDFNPFSATNKNKKTSHINSDIKAQDHQQQPEMPNFKKKFSSDFKKSPMDKGSLEFSSSQSPQHRQPIKQPPTNNLQSSKNSEFTLNPALQTNSLNQNKFNTFSHGNEDQQMDQQILDQSKYQQSVPHAQRFISKPPPQSNTFSQKQPSSKPPIKQIDKQRQKIQNYYQKSIQHGQHIDKKQKDSQSKKSQQSVSQMIFQQMIKNPPQTMYRFDQPLNPYQASDNLQPQQQKPKTQNITEVWSRVLELVELNEINQAYSLTFQIDDPIYMLRLMLLTKIPLKKLTPANICTLWQKFLDIYQHRFIDSIFVQLLTSANKLNGLSRSLSIEQLNQLLIDLYQLSGRTKGKLSFGAASLYNQIQQSLSKTGSDKY